MIAGLLFSFLNVNHLLPLLISQYGPWVYVGLFMIIFIETGLVVFPFLPGDSLLFLSGSIAEMSSHSLNPIILIVVLSIAAIVGDGVNFEIGKRTGRKLISSKLSRWIKPKHLEQAELFFERHGNSSIFIGRFIPFIRTFIPFIRTFIPFTAGMSKMKYRHFVAFNILGGVVWVTVVVMAGYLLGNIAIVKAHFELIMFMIVLISILPVTVTKLRQRYVRGEKNETE